ncbi:ATP-binding protein [Paraburkholderia sp. MM5384-R2]|uniref:hybrid sensor histidine kinase/response regulator n=1 Tax=Paraburkholderia sp. MM5384-R2 TaxID=2723097 RepID=UPI001607E073|nr:ATP-binding protein [Paraburkholderia sp. MM5384-R2]MBB5501177.1 signal transduction histidine kinase/ActR/RegA family two-component response regulator [Paraburkholderia sp. MM5384-R2]
MKRHLDLDSRGAITLNGLARRLGRTREQLMHRWIAETSEQAAHADADSGQGLMGCFAYMLDEVCAALLVAESDAPLSVHVAVAHPGRFWPEGWRVTDLFRNIDLMQRFLKDEIRAYFGPVATSVEVHMRAHDIVERTFRAMIENAIEAQMQRQAAEVAAAQGSLHTALTALKLTEERLRVATSAAGIGIFEWCGASRQGVWENRQMYDITGQPEERGPLTETEFMTSVVHPDDVELLKCHFQSRLVSGEPVHVAFRLHRVTDRALRTVEMFGYLRPPAQQDDYTFIGSLCDVTEWTDAEAKLQDADRRKDIFLATLAHELRNPLAPVRNAAHLLGHGAGADPAKREWLRNVIERQTGHLSHLIDDLLDVSRITTGKIELKREVFDIRLALDHALEITMPAASQRHHDIVRLPLAHPVYVHGDPARITQTFANLLDNAIKYTDDGGRIVVCATLVGQEVSVTVSDTGTGISGDALPHVFDLFVQGSCHGEPSRGGLGIGLSVCKTLTEMHGGTIVARSEGKNRGSEFEIRLPVCRGSNQRAKDGAEAGRPPSDPLRVLIVDDNSDAALSLAMILDAHDVRTAHSGEEALQIAAAFEPQIVFLDLGLPGISGYEVARRLRDRQAAGKRLEIVAVSGYGQPEDVARSAGAGCDSHLVKPVDIEELLAIIRRMTSENPSTA